MEKKRLLVTDELIITGIRHGDLADRLMPLISKEGTVDLKEVLKLTGDEDTGPARDRCIHRND